MTLALCPLTVGAEEKLPLRLIKTIPMPGFTGDFDHFGLDLKGNRLFLASEDQRTFEVFDLQTGERIHSIKGFGQPLTMAYLAESDRLIVTDGGDSDAVELVDCTEYKIIDTLKLGSGVDHSAYNPVNKYFYVENGGGPDAKTHVLTIIDTKSLTRVGEVAGLPGNSNKGMVIDDEGKKLYVNPTGTDEIGVIDLNTRQLIAKSPLPDAHVAHAIALDESKRRPFTATRRPAEFIVFNMDTGKVVVSLPRVGVNSDRWVDFARKRIYVTGSEAHLSSNSAMQTITSMLPKCRLLTARNRQCLCRDSSGSMSLILVRERWTQNWRCKFSKPNNSTAALPFEKGRNPGFRPYRSRIGCGGQI
jgi:hypothetical protein